jgi:hypothetical protein
VVCARRRARSQRQRRLPERPGCNADGYLRGCAPLNLFGGTRNITPEAAAWIIDPKKVASQWIEQTVGEVSMNGSTGIGLPAGDISAAFGLSYRKETLDQRTVDPADEYPALPDGRLFSDLGLAPAGIRGLIPCPAASARAYLPAIRACASWVRLHRRW